MALLISEILDKVDKVKSKQEKINILQEHNTPCLRTLMRLNFDNTFAMDLPEGDPPYKKVTDTPIGYQATTLNLEFRRFYIWLEPNQLSKIKKESIFIELLESLHWTEAEVLLACKDRRLTKKYKSIKEDLIREAYPRTLPAKVEPVKAPLQ
mgnify:CR=1 FL=1